MCRRFGVSRGGYYAWRCRQESLRARGDRRLTARITAIFEASEQTYGAPRIHAALAQANVQVGRKRVARLMKASGLRARSRRIYRRTPGTRRFFEGIPNRTLGLDTTDVDQVWVGDVTFLKVLGGWRYLAVVMDRHSRRVVGWKLDAHRDLALTKGSLDTAAARRHPSPGLIFHTDRGIEYSAYGFRTRLAALGMTQSMKRPRELGDNAFIESFFGSMKAEIIHGAAVGSEAALRRAIVAYIRRYNRSRLHSSIGYRSPIDFELASA